MVTPLHGVERMPGCVEGAVWRNEHVVAKGHTALIENHQIGVGKEILANLDVEPIVAKEW